MIDWLAEQYVLLLAKTAFFLQNPTACQWIEFFQVASVGLGLIWATRTSYFAFRGYRVSEKGNSHPTSSIDAVKLGTAFALVREKIATLAGGRFAKRATDRWRIRIHPGPGVLLCNVGFFRPRILVSRKAIETLDTMELSAAVAHELTHSLRRGQPEARRGRSSLLRHPSWGVVGGVAPDGGEPPWGLSDGALRRPRSGTCSPNGSRPARRLPAGAAFPMSRLR